MKNKWFYAALDKAVEILSNGSVSKRCIYQIVTHSRVIELWGIKRSETDGEKLHFVQITKQGSRASLMVYEVTELKAAMPIMS